MDRDGLEMETSSPRFFSTWIF